MNCSNQPSTDQTETVTQTFDWDERDGVQTTVIETIAAVTDQKPTEMEPLSHFVDPEALDSLFAPTSSTPRNMGRVEFQYQDCMVALSAGGTVAVTPQTH